MEPIHRYFRKPIVAKMLACGMTRKQIISIHKMFGVCKNAINLDIIDIENIDSVPKGFYINTPRKMKELIFKRDNNTCQYCGTKTGIMIIEHVIATRNGGYAAPYNLVVACQRCNMRKRSNYWIPNNIEVLRKLNPEWVDKIYENYEKVNRH